jgi:hypothetical protein
MWLLTKVYDRRIPVYTWETREDGCAVQEHLINAKD